MTALDDLRHAAELLPAGASVTLTREALLAAIGVCVGALVSSQLAGVIGVFVWCTILESLIGGLYHAVWPYLPYTAATTLAGISVGGAAFGPAHGATNGTALPFIAAAALLAALAALTARHEALRTVVAAAAGLPSQAVVPGDDAAERCGEAAGSQRPFQIAGHRQVAERVGGRQLGQEPETLLGERERQGPVARHPLDGPQRARVGDAEPAQLHQQPQHLRQLRVVHEKTFLSSASAGPLVRSR